MPDPAARQRLKNKMLDRWESEGGRIAADTTAAGDNRPTSKDKGEGKKLSSSRNNPTIGALASPTKRRKSTPK